MVDRSSRRRDAEPVRSGVLRFDWYLDRHRIVYTTLTESGMELRAANLETDEDRLLYAGPHTEMILSPDGTRDRAGSVGQPLRPGALPAQTGDSHHRGWLAADRLGELERITDGQGRWHVHNGSWSHDGTRIVYTQDTDDGDIYLLTLED